MIHTYEIVHPFERMLHIGQCLKFCFGLDFDRRKGVLWCAKLSCAAGDKMVDQGLALARVLLSDTTQFSSSMRPLTQRFTKVYVSTYQLESLDMCFIISWL